MNWKLNMRPSLFISLALLLLTLAAYWPVLDCRFLNYDDNKYVTSNPHVVAGLTLEGFRWAFQAGYGSNWHPLTWFSHMADCQFFGLNPRWHHFVNLIFHIANALLLFGVLNQMTGAHWRSAVVAALFALHPAHVESVAWVAERKDVLSTFFFLLTLDAYVRYAREPCPGKLETRGSRIRHPGSYVTSPRALFYALALLFFALGLMSKPMLVTVPFLLLLLDFWPLARLPFPLQRSNALTLQRPDSAPLPHPLTQPLRLIAEKLPFFALSALSSLITVVAQRRGGSIVSVEVVSLDQRFWNALVSYLRYAGELFWPRNLAIIYPYVDHWPAWLIATTVAFLLTLTWFALRFARQAPYFPVGWLWFLGTLVPVIGLVQVGEQAMADRYTYIPSIGFFLMICWGIPQLAAKRPKLKRSLATSACLALAACSIATRAQLACWRDTTSLFEHAIAVTENNAVAHGNLGLALMNSGHIEEAIRHYETALQIRPTYSPAHNNLGVALMRLGRFDEALAQYRTAIALHPEDADVHYNLANALNPGFAPTPPGGGDSQNERLNPQESRREYQAALALNPELLNAHINWGNLELAEGNFDAALTHYQDALRLQPRSALAHLDLGNLLLKMGRTDEAVSNYITAIEIHPADPEGHFRLANLLAGQGNLQGAIAHYQRALELDPSHSVACCNLGAALAKTGKIKDAGRYFAEAIRINPKYVEAHSNLGKALETQGKIKEAAAEYSEALRIAPDNPDLHRRLALLLSTQGKTEEALAHLSEAIQLNPQSANAEYDLGLLLAKAGKADAAVEHFRAVLCLKPDSVPALNNLAWILATDPRPEVRNGNEAVTLARRACELTGYKDPRVLGTLDAAYAEAGQFKQALATAHKTWQLAQATGAKALADTAQARLKLYQAGKPFHESDTDLSH